MEGAEGGAIYHSNKSVGSVDNFVTYTFDVERDGCYLIEEYHPVVPQGGCGDFNPGEVPLRIDYCRGEHAWTTVNQAVGGGQWNSLGRLPYYTREGSYTLSLRERSIGGSKVRSPKRQWMADAFRLTWLARSCHEYDHKKAQEAKKPTPREVLMDEEEKAKKDDASDSAPEEKTSQVAKESDVAAAFQLLLNEPRDDGAHSKFFFKVPFDGCFMIEERHPHIKGGSGSVSINYCKGFTASGDIDHTNGKHDQWNYVAALPFFDDHDGSIILPRELVSQGEGQHHFRVTHVGASCRAHAAQVYSAELRIQADFARVQNMKDAFKESLMSLLGTRWLQPAGVHAARAAITDVRKGSIIAEVTVLPTSHGSRLDGPHSLAAVSSLNDYMASSGFQQEICTIAKAENPSCAVSVTSGRVAPLVSRSKFDAAKGVKAQDEGIGETALVGVIVGAAFAVVAISACCLYAWRKRQSKAMPTDAGNDVTPKDDSAFSADYVKKDAETQWEDSSTLTPDFDAAPTEDIEDSKV